MPVLNEPTRWPSGNPKGRGAGRSGFESRFEVMLAGNHSSGCECKLPTLPLLNESVGVVLGVISGDDNKFTYTLYKFCFLYAYASNYEHSFHCHNLNLI